MQNFPVGIGSLPAENVEFLAGRQKHDAAWVEATRSFQFRFLIRSSTTAGSAKVDVSPFDPASDLQDKTATDKIFQFLQSRLRQTAAEMGNPIGAD